MQDDKSSYDTAIPLSEIDPNWIHPVLNKKPYELIDQNNWNKESLLSLVDNKKFIL